MINFINFLMNVKRFISVFCTSQIKIKQKWKVSYGNSNKCNNVFICYYQQWTHK